MKLIIDGENISNTEVQILLDGKNFCTEWINHNSIEIILGNITADSISCKFWIKIDERQNITDSLDCDQKNEDNSDGINDDLIAPDLQYPYITTIKEPNRKDIVRLVPKRMMIFNDFIIFTPDNNINVIYSIKENENTLRHKIRNDIKKNIKDFAIIYPFAIVIAVLCVVLPNFIDSYSLARLLGPIFFFSILAPPIATILFTKDYIKMRRFLLENPQLSPDWLEKSEMKPMEGIKK